jgi:DNA-directed RNA polymerase subunit RPC12/RpoP
MILPRKKVLTVVVIWGHNQGDNGPILRTWMRTPSCRCLNCGHKLNTVGTPDRDPSAIPDEGNYTVCLYCSHLMIFRPDLTVRNLTDAEVVEAAGDKELLEAMAFADAFRKWKKDNEQT